MQRPTTDEHGDVGYVLEVDLDYPDHLHETHNDYPLAPEGMEIQGDMLSEYCTNLRDKLDITSAPPRKLVPNLMNKTKYVVHLRNLKFYIDQGMVLTKIHRVLKFRQEAFMEKYIMFNTGMRALAKNDFEKDLFKLMNNSVFGKTMENVRQYQDIVLVTSKEKLAKLTADPRFKRESIFSKDLVAVHRERRDVVLNKPIYIGFAVLDLSKLLMYDFHYNHVQKGYPGKARLLFTDTDSLCYHIETEDIYRDMGEDGQMYDFSDYPTNHHLHSNANKKVIEDEG
jgi:hypothetical protein